MDTQIAARLEQELIKFYNLTNDRIVQFPYATAFDVKIDNVLFFVHIFNDKSINPNHIKAKPSHAYTLVIDEPIGNMSIEQIDAKLRAFVARRKTRMAKKIVKIKNVLDFIKFKLYENGIEFADRGNHIVLNVSPILWYISYCKSNAGEEQLTLMLNSPSHGKTYIINGCLADPNNKLFEQVMDIITYFKNFNVLVNKWGWTS